eukprot:1887142-Prorocentrum_lima.AAC.1
MPMTAISSGGSSSRQGPWMSASSTKVNLATLATLGPGARCRAEVAVSDERDERTWPVYRP